MRYVTEFARAATAAVEELLQGLPEHEQAALADACRKGALMSIGFCVSAGGQSAVFLDLIDNSGKAHRVLSVTAE